MARVMKDSGIEWIGEIPEDWEVEKNKHAFECSKEIVGNNWETTQLLSLTTKGIKEKSADQLSGKIPESFDTYQTVSPNDMVMCLFDLDCSAVFSGISPYNGMISPAYKVLKCKDNMLPLFADYWFSFIFNGRKFKNYSKNLRYTLTYDEFGVLPILLPHISEQARIATFLDRKCAEIDNVITETEKTIEEYKALKQSIITEAVTKGVRGKRPMKDSGIEWIGKMPEEWQCTKAKYCININNGSDPITSGDIPVYGSGAASFKTCGEYKEGPTVLIGRKGATLHIPHYIEGKYWNVDTAFDVKAKEGFALRYYYFLAGVFDYKFYISQTTLPGMTQTNYENMFLPVPIITEQQEIVDYLDVKCKEIEQLVESKQKLLEQLEYLKKSIIYEYITGKKEIE